jgi:hypothetical protein
MNKAPEVTARHIDLEGLVDLNGKSLDQVLFALDVPSVVPKSVARAVLLSHQKTGEIAADEGLSAKTLSLVLKKIIGRNYEELCQKITELRDRDRFDLATIEPLPAFESVYSRITVTDFDLIALFQAVLRRDLSLVYGVNLTNEDFIYLSQRWGTILTCDALLKKMLLSVDHRKHILAILSPSTNSVSAIVQNPSAASKSRSRLRAPTVAGPQMPPPLPSVQTAERLVELPATRLRAPTLAGPVLPGTKPPDLPFAREKTRPWTRPDDRNAAVEIKAESKTAEAVPIALSVEEKAAPGTVLPTAGVTPVVDGSAGSTSLDLSFDREQTRPWISSERLTTVKMQVSTKTPEPDAGELPVEKDINPGVTDSAAAGETPLADRAPSVHSVGGTSASTSTIPTRTHAWRKLVPTFGAVAVLGVMLGMGVSKLTRSKQREQFVVSAPATVVHPPMPSRLPMPPEVTPVAPVITGYVPEPPSHIPVVPFTPGMQASVATAIRRSLIANNARTLVCVPGSGAKREMDFRYFIDAVTHIAANQSPLVRSWRLVGNVSTYTTTLDSIAPDCKSFAFTLYRGTAEVVPSTRVTFVTNPADLIAARRRSGRIPTPLPQSERINFAQ